jgi:hypothetical protein
MAAEQGQTKIISGKNVLAKKCPMCMGMMNVPGYGVGDRHQRK